jgi:hypothetical protein
LIDAKIIGKKFEKPSIEIRKLEKGILSEIISK